MCDKKEKPENAETDGSRSGATMPDFCGPMVERMFKAFCEAAEDSSIGSPAQDRGTDAAASCASAMQRMASSCCGHQSTEEVADK